MKAKAIPKEQRHLLHAAQVLVNGAELISDQVDAVSPAGLDISTIGEAVFVATIKRANYRVTVTRAPD